MKYTTSFLSIVLGGTLCLSQNSIQGPQKPVFSTDQFKLLTRRRDFALQFVSNGKGKQIPVPRDWLVPPDEEKAEEGNYVSSLLYGKQVTSFPIGNGKIGLQLSSYEIQKEGSAQAAAGRDVFLIFDPASSMVFRGGIERGITKERVRSQGCFAAKADNYYLADVNGDGLTAGMEGVSPSGEPGVRPQRGFRALANLPCLEAGHAAPRAARWPGAECHQRVATVHGRGREAVCATGAAHGVAVASRAGPKRSDRDKRSPRRIGRWQNFASAGRPGIHAR